MDEHILQALSKSLTHLIFRNGAVEHLHAAGACLDDETMAKLGSCKVCQFADAIK